MHGRSSILFPLALLALLAALTFWIDRTVQPPQPKRDGSSRHDMDYKLNNFSTTKSDLDGNPRYVLSATELIHFPDDDSTQLARPRFTQYFADKPYMQIQGQRGQVSSNGENVYFMDNVQVVRGAMPGRGELKVLTEYLHVLPEQEIAVTDRPVSILQAPHTVIHGSGMEYDKKQRTLKLSGRVRVHYERPGAEVSSMKAPPPLKAAPSVGMSTHKFDAARGIAPQAVVQPVKQVTQKKLTARKSTKQAKPSKNKTGKTTTRIRRQYETSAR